VRRVQEGVDKDFDVDAYLFELDEVDLGVGGKEKEGSERKGSEVSEDVKRESSRYQRESTSRC